MPNNLSSVNGVDLNRPIDAIFVNSPLRDYSIRPKVDKITLPVLGLGYIATFASQSGFNVGVLDAEAEGLTLDDVASLVNNLKPRWWGMNLLAPTYEISASIATLVDSSIPLMLGGHQAKAMPLQILNDPRMSSCEALILGEGETSVASGK